MLLLYCMAQDDDALMLPPQGVRGSKVEVIHGDGVGCFYSSHEEFASTSPDQAKKDAIDFHWVVHHIFQQRAVIPFRFPTLISGAQGIKDFLEKNGAAYRADLKRLDGYIQMEVRIQAAPVEAGSARATSGTEYLKTRLDAAQRSIEAIRQIKAAAPPADWQQRDIAGTTRLFALVPRGLAEEFRSSVNAASAALSGSIRVSGPWPATEFVNCYPEIESQEAPPPDHD